ncbi:uncharacterized protein ACLA_053030 [Aspergillus clavatus NRRL 1]|uniref:Tachykinin family protein n=1 Tax=Aspergillus clavatus (strain ATCC 1007 / CBS 513.65 / DSM 816 / NCTC 3887 / NRRL 1 / QM 1276 / 107) TaxID=344612 RepID=A1CIX4_ASPCL|nr:uncharacterized protein ACLA_053030 [Aspergillus clavatus NRRL 1]EAW10829.1 hypothetical protein ACLA_053030 [Aspergillus clavatus NRRL 1]
MFIPYRGPSKTKDQNTRRAINAFVAADANSRRRRRNEDAKSKPSSGTLQWLQIPHPKSDPQHPPGEGDGAGRGDRQAQSLAMARPIGGSRFYPLEGFVSKGPMTGRALSYYFDILLPHDARALGLGDAGTRSYGNGLLAWASKHNLILHGLSAFTLCSLDSQDSTGRTSRAITYHRNVLLKELHERLSRRQVDDVLIQAITLLIPVDDYLGHAEYGPVHLKGLNDVVQLRGGFGAIGTSDEAAFGSNLRMSVQVTMSLVEFHLQTNMNQESDTIVGPVSAPSSPSELQIKASGLPPGFRDLIDQGCISDQMIDVLYSFMDWSIKGREIDPSARGTWRCSTARDLNNLEKCIVVTLACLADDISAMGTHPATIIFRKPKQRAAMLARVAEVWDNPLFVDCVIWMCTVVSTPRNRDILCREAQRRLLLKAIRCRYCALQWGDIRQVLERFIYESGRAADWEEAWSRALKDPRLVTGETDPFCCPSPCVLPF